MLRASATTLLPGNTLLYNSRMKTKWNSKGWQLLSDVKAKKHVPLIRWYDGMMAGSIHCTSTSSHDSLEWESHCEAWRTAETQTSAPPPTAQPLPPPPACLGWGCRTGEELRCRCCCQARRIRWTSPCPRCLPAKSWSRWLADDWARILAKRSFFGCWRSAVALLGTCFEGGSVVASQEGCLTAYI
jgi:hypothetical protein